MILADDLGYGDVQCNNPQRGKIPTPNIDRLARDGMRFTDGHSSSGVCSPSRYALLTGRYHWRSRLQTGIVGVFEQPLIAPDRMTIASLAKEHGYQTACVGKWHLGWDWPLEDKQRGILKPQNGKGKNADASPSPEQLEAWQEVFSKPIAGGPTTRGFDFYFGTDVPNWPPYCFIKDNRTIGIPTTFLPAKLFRNNLASQQGPALPDWDLAAVLPTLAEQATRFITTAAAKHEPYLLYLPLTSPHTPIAVAEDWQGKSDLKMSIADFIMQTDGVVGEVLKAVEASGEAEDTLVLFTSDNGFAAYAGATELEKKGHFPSGPLRGYKTSVFEGGHRVPFIVRWPKVVQPNQACEQLVHHADVLATLADIFETTLPADAGEDSFSLLPLLQGKTEPIREHAVSCAANGVPGVRLRNWKLIASADSQAKTEVQLYNLQADLGETKNLAADDPSRVAEMQQLLEKIITDGRSTPGERQKNDVTVRRFPPLSTKNSNAPQK